MRFDACKRTRFACWQAAIKIGEDELDRGEGILYTAQVSQAITESAMADNESGLDPDVLT